MLSLQGAKCEDAAHSDLLRRYHMEPPHEWDRDDKYDDIDEDVGYREGIVDL